MQVVFSRLYNICLSSKLSVLCILKKLVFCVLQLELNFIRYGTRLNYVQTYNKYWSVIVAQASNEACRLKYVTEMLYQKVLVTEMDLLSVIYS